MAKATYDSIIPVSGANFSSFNIRNNFQSLAQGDSEPLRPRAQASPDMTVAIAGTQVEGYYHNVYNDYTEPFEFATQNSPQIVAPGSSNRLDILVVSGATASGTLHWVTGAEASTPTLPSIPEEMLPVCAVYCKTTMDRILNYEERDTDTDEGYIYSDLRPKVVIKTTTPLWETDGGDAELKTADDIDMQTKKLKNLVAGSSGADSIRYDQAMKEGDTAGGVLAGTYPDPKINATMKSALYFEPDPSCILAFGNGRNGLDLSYLQNVISLTSLSNSDLVAGKISHECYEFDGASDYVTIAHAVEQAGMSEITLEGLMYRDDTDSKIVMSTATDKYIVLYIDNTNVIGNLTGSGGTETWSVAHGLSGNGQAQWIYVVVTCVLGSAANIYISGASVGNGDGSGGGTLNDSANGIFIGELTGEATWRAQGKLDGIRILRRIMSPTEISNRNDVFVL